MAHIPDERLFSFAERAEGKVVVLTGGSSGIGKRSCLEFAKHGAKVVIGDIDTAGAEKTVAEIKAAGGEAVSTKCDVRSWDEQVDLFELAMKAYGAVDIVVPNAGVTEFGQFHTHKFSEDGKKLLPPNMKTLDVNLTGVLYTTHLALHYLKLNRVPGSLKSIVLIGSMASWSGITGAPMYTGSKHAVLGLMRSLTPIVKKEDIRIATIHPWFANTDILNLPIKVILAGIPMVPVERIAGAIFYTATDPDKETSGSAWLLADDGPLFMVEKEQFKFGVYKMIDERVNKITKGVEGIVVYARILKMFAVPITVATAAIVVGGLGFAGKLW